MRSDAQNLQRVIEVIENDFALNLQEFSRLNDEVANLLAEDEKIYDQEIWFEPKMTSITRFMKETKKWIADIQECILQKEKYEDVDTQDTVKPSDSVSQIDVNDAGYPAQVDLRLVARQSQHESHQHALNKKLNMQPCLNVWLHRRKGSSLSLK